LFDQRGTVFLRVENPGRSVKELLNALETAAGFGFYAEAVLFTNGRPAALFDTVQQSRLVGLKLSGAVIGEDVVARIELASKLGMEPAELAILKDIRYTVDSAVFEVLFGSVRGQVAFNANGLVKMSGQLSPKLLDLIEAELDSLFRR
jgi:hypothetical protein